MSIVKVTRLRGDRKMYCLENDIDQSPVLGKRKRGPDGEELLPRSIVATLCSYPDCGNWCSMTPPPECDAAKKRYARLWDDSTSDVNEDDYEPPE